METQTIGDVQSVVDKTPPKEEAKLPTAPAIPKVEQQKQEEAQEEPSTESQTKTANVLTGDTADVWLNQKDGSKTILFSYSKEEIQKAYTATCDKTAFTAVIKGGHIKNGIEEYLEYL